MPTRTVPWSWVSPGSTVQGPSGRQRLVLGTAPGVVVLADPVQVLQVGADEMTTLVEASETEALVAILTTFPAAEIIEMEE